MEEAESDLLDSSFLERMWLLREALEYGIASGDTPKLLVIEESNTGTCIVCIRISKGISMLGLVHLNIITIIMPVKFV